MSMRAVMSMLYNTTATGKLSNFIAASIQQGPPCLPQNILCPLHVFEIWLPFLEKLGEWNEMSSGESTFWKKAFDILLTHELLLPSTFLFVVETFVWKTCWKVTDQGERGVVGEKKKQGKD